jgi:hypothetical protein
MTELIELSRVDYVELGSPGSPPPRRHTGPFQRGSRAFVVLLAVLLVIAAATGFALSGFGSSPPSGASALRSIRLVSQSYTPQRAYGTDDYHCNLVNPHVTRDAFVVWSQFNPGSPEVHHAVLSVVPPSLAAKALAENANTRGTGWTCFGAPSLPDATITDFFNTPFLGEWAPGHGADALPKGTGIALPTGSLLIEQVHYNLLVGDKPVRNSLVLETAPAAAPLLPLHDTMAIAPPEVPCPAGVTSPLCSRDASLTYLGHRFGQEAAQLPNLLELACGHDPSNPPVGDTTSCTWPMRTSGYIVRAQGHMHLLGRSFSIVLNPGTAQARTVLSVPNYNFHDQKAYNLGTPIQVRPGDRIQVTCTYDPTLAEELPILRRAPAHFVTFGDGSSDEMCVGLAWTTVSLPNPHSAL